MAKNEQIRVDITATDAASEVLDEVADAAEQVEELSPEVEVTADASAAETDIAAVDALVDELEKRAPEVEVVATADTGTAEGDLKELGDTADAVGTLTPEVVATADTGTAEGDLKGVADVADALSRADAEIVVTAKIDQAKADLKKAQNALDDVSGATRKIGDEADNSKSVMANFAGNTVSEMPGVAGAFGPVNQALGQFGEYAAEGNISMQNFVKTAGPMAAMAIAAKGISDTFADIAATKAFNSEQAEAFEKALKDSDDAATAVADTFRDLGKIEIRLFDKTIDMAPALADAGVTVEQFGDLVAGGADKLATWGKAATDAGADQGSVNKVMLAATKSADNLGKANENAAVHAKVFGDAEKDTSVAIGYVTSSAKAGAENIKMMEAAHDADVEAAEAHAAALEAEADRLTEMANAARASVDAGFALRDSQRRAKEAAANVNAVMKTEGATLDDLAAALDDSSEAALDAADAAVKQREETKKAKGETISATGKIDIFNSSVLDQAANLRGPARDALIAHIGKVNDIPPKKASEIQALIDAGKLEAAKRKLADASRTRTATVTADANTAAAETEINDTARDRDVTLNVSALYPSGFITLPGGAVIPGPRMVAPPPPGPTPLPTEVVNVTMNLPRGYRELDVVAAGRRAARRSGGLYRRTRR